MFSLDSFTLYIHFSQRHIFEHRKQLQILRFSSHSDLFFIFLCLRQTKVLLPYLHPSLLRFIEFVVKTSSSNNNETPAIIYELLYAFQQINIGKSYAITLKDDKKGVFCSLRMIIVLPLYRSANHRFIYKHVPKMFRRNMNLFRFCVLNSHDRGGRCQ